MRDDLIATRPTLGPVGNSAPSSQGLLQVPTGLGPQRVERIGEGILRSRLAGDGARFKTNGPTSNGNAPNAFLSYYDTFRLIKYIVPRYNKATKNP